MGDIRPKDPEVRENLAYLLSRSGKEMRRYLSGMLSEVGSMYRDVHLRALMILYYHDGMNQQDLAEKLELDKTAVTRLLSQMEENGLIVRVENKTDKRSKLVYITNAGREARNEIIPVLLKCVGSIEEKLDPKDLEVTKRVLGQIIDILCDSPGDECRQ